MINDLLASALTALEAADLDAGAKTVLRELASEATRRTV